MYYWILIHSYTEGKRSFIQFGWVSLWTPCSSSQMEKTIKRKDFRLSSAMTCGCVLTLCRSRRPKKKRNRGEMKDLMEDWGCISKQSPVGRSHNRRLSSVSGSDRSKTQCSTILSPSVQSSVMKTNTVYYEIRDSCPAVQWTNHQARCPAGAAPTPRGPSQPPQ